MDISGPCGEQSILKKGGVKAEKKAVLSRASSLSKEGDGAAPAWAKATLSWS